MTYKRWQTQIRRWQIDLKISEVVAGKLTRWRNDRNSCLIQVILPVLPIAWAIAALTNPSYIACAASHLRKSSHPKYLTDLEFELNTECLPEHFLRTDVRAGSKRHLVFATDA